MPSTHTLRVKHFITTHTWSLVIVFLCVIIASGALLATPAVSPAVSHSPYADPPETPPPETHSVSLEQHTQATTTENTSAWPANHTLVDRSRYPRHNISTPQIEASVKTADATVSNVTIAIIYTASPPTEDAPPFYRSTTQLVRSPPGNDQMVTTSLPVSDITSRSAELQSQFGPRADVSIRLRTTAQYTYTSAAGITHSNTVTTTGPVGFTEALLSIPYGTADESHTTGSAPPPTPFRGSLLNLLSVVCIGGGSGGLLITAVTSYRHSPSSVYQQLQHSRYQEWITTVESYTPDGDTKTVVVASLPELVDLAIDHRVRTLYHQPTDEYLVSTDDVLYKYRPQRSEGGYVEYYGLDKPDSPLPTPSQPSPRQNGHSQPSPPAPDTSSQQPASDRSSTAHSTHSNSQATGTDKDPAVSNTQASYTDSDEHPNSPLTNGSSQPSTEPHSAAGFDFPLSDTTTSVDSHAPSSDE